MNWLRRLLDREASQRELQARVEEAERELPALRRELSDAVRNGRPEAKVLSLEALRRVRER